MKKVYFLFLFGVLFNTFSIAQSQLTLYQLNAQLPQANQVNAGLFPEYKISVGLPVLSSSYVSVNSGKLTYNRAFTRTADDSLRFDPQRLANNLDENNRLEVNANTQLFYLGLRLKKNYFSIGLNERVEGGITYPKTFVQLLGSGNGAYIGEMLKFDNFGFRAQAYHELSFGYGRDITEKLSVGVRAKFLSGVVGIDVDNISAALLTTTDSLYLQTPAFNINSSGLDLIDGTTDIFKAATAFNNPGFAIDLGAHYWITDEIRVSLAVNDLGAINWKDDTRQLQFDEVKYSFKGVDFISAIDKNNQADLFSQETDSLGRLFRPDTVEGIAYKTRLAPKIYAGGTYHLGKYHTFGALFYGDVFKGTFKPAFGLSYNLQLGHIWTIGVNASYRNGTFNNFGLGTTLTLGPVQIYALTESVTALTKLSDARFVDGRVGINLVFGRLNRPQKTKREKERKAKKPKPPPETIEPSVALTESVTTAIMGSADDELAQGFYVVIASFNTDDESMKYNMQLLDEGYAALSGYQSEKEKYFVYLMYFPEDGNKAIAKKNDLTNSFAPGLDKPWVLWVKEE
jgi:Family of unknown function (DUF5723)